MVTGMFPPGMVAVSPPDASLCAWALGECVRSLQARGLGVPEELIRLHLIFRGAARSASATDRAAEAVSVSASAQHQLEEVTVAEASAVLGFSRQYVRRLFAAGTLAGRRAGDRMIMLDADAVRAYAQRRKAA